MTTNPTPTRPTLGSLVLAGLLATSGALAQDPGFFVTSAGTGHGGDLGGLQGADAHCQSLAEAAGHGDRTWRAYLSTQGDDAVHARERIGPGPWHNVNGELIAGNLEELHRESVNITRDTALDENGKMVPYVHVSPGGTILDPQDQPAPVEHDILTGSMADGMAFGTDEDRTCGNWTSSGEGSAMLGHSDRRSVQPGLSPWAAAHPSWGCSQQSLANSGGSGRFYCFAVDRQGGQP